MFMKRYKNPEPREYTIPVVILTGAGHLRTRFALDYVGAIADYYVITGFQYDGLAAMIKKSLPEHPVFIDKISAKTRDHPKEIRKCQHNGTIPSFTRFYLVTNRSHMPRSRMIFRKYGFDPIPIVVDESRPNLRELWYFFRDWFVLTFGGE